MISATIIKIHILKLDIFWKGNFYDNVVEKDSRSLVQAFFKLYDDLDKEYDVYDLEENCKTMWDEGTVSKNVLPIAEDPFGNFICLSINEEDFGTIYFADHEYEDAESGYLFMSKIASSFTEFLNCMYLDD